MSEPRWIDRSPSAYAHRALEGVLADLPPWFRWGLAWIGLIGAMMVA